VDSDAAIGEMRRLAREFGLFVGPSSGAHLLAARERGARACGTSSRFSATRARSTSTTTSSAPDQAAQRRHPQDLAPGNPGRARAADRQTGGYPVLLPGLLLAAARRPPGSGSGLPPVADRRCRRDRAPAWPARRFVGGSGGAVPCRSERRVRSSTPARQVVGAEERDRGGICYSYWRWLIGRRTPPGTGHRPERCSAIQRRSTNSSLTVIATR
jgi:hypothetical protein